MSLNGDKMKEKIWGVCLLTENLKKCSKCQTIIPEGEDFCPKCTGNYSLPNYSDLPKSKSLPIYYVVWLS